MDGCADVALANMLIPKEGIDVRMCALHMSTHLA